MGRPKLDERMETVSVRLPRATVERIDGYLETLRAEVPLLLLGRGDAVRQLIAMGLDAAMPPKPKRRKKSA